MVDKTLKSGESLMQDGLEHWSILDFIASACQKDKNYAKMVWNRLKTNSEHTAELSALTKYFVFEG